MKTFTQAGLVILLVVAVGAGFWLNRMTWRHRRLVWQLQAAVVAGGVGFVTGRLTAEMGSDDLPSNPLPRGADEAQSADLHRDDEGRPSADG